MEPISRRIISIIRPKQPHFTSNPAAAQNTKPTIISETLSGAANIMQQAMIIIRVSNISIFQQFTTLISEHISSEKCNTEVDAKAFFEYKLCKSQHNCQSHQYNGYLFAKRQSAVFLLSRHNCTILLPTHLLAPLLFALGIERCESLIVAT